LIRRRTNIHFTVRTTFHLARIFCASILLSVAYGCTVKQAIKPPIPTSFISFPELLRKPTDSPFALAWTSPEVSTWIFDKVVVEAVRTDQLDSDKWLFSAGSFITTRERYRQQVNKLADYIQKSLTERLLKKKKREREVAVIDTVAEIPVPSETRAALAEPPSPIAPLDPVTPGSRTMLIQISISEATYGDPLIYGGLLAVPVPAIANLSTAVKSPSLTLETMFVDQATGEVVAEVVDRRFPQIKIVDLNRLLGSRALRELSDSYIEDIAELFFRKRGEEISRRSPVSLIPW
jgi:hypothetical protein